MFLSLQFQIGQNQAACWSPKVVHELSPIHQELSGIQTLQEDKEYKIRVQNPSNQIMELIILHSYIVALEKLRCEVEDSRTWKRVCIKFHSQSEEPSFGMLFPDFM